VTSPGPAVSALALVLTLAGAAQAAPVGAHLSWVRDNAASDYPDAAAIQGEVARRLGEDPFRRAPTQFIEAMVTRSGDTYQVTIAMRAADGSLIGNRTLTSAAGDCRSISTAAGLTIAILIDPDALARPVAPPPPPPPSPAPAPPPSSAAPPPAGIAGRVTALVAGGWGSLPVLSAGAGLSAVFDVTDHVALGAVATLFPERRTAAPDDGFAFGLSTGGVLACYVPTTTSARDLRWELCAGLTAGVLHAVVYAPEPIDPGQRWYLAATQLTRFIIPVLRLATIEAGLEASEPFPRHAFFVEGRPAGKDTVFTQPAVAVTASLGVGLRWR
jgi:hypothetical protein